MHTKWLSLFGVRDRSTNARYRSRVDGGLVQRPCNLRLRATASMKAAARRIEGGSRRRSMVFAVLDICEARYRDVRMVVRLMSRFSSILRMGVVLRGVSADMIPWGTGPDEDMHFDLNAWIAVYATERDAVHLAVMTATERRAAPATET